MLGIGPIPIVAVATAILCGACSSDDAKKGLYESCGDVSECDADMVGDDVLCAAGPTSTAKVCTVKCSQIVQEDKGYAPVHVGDCITDAYAENRVVCGSGCCNIDSSAQADDTDTTYAVYGVCVASKP